MGQAENAFEHGNRRRRALTDARATNGGANQALTDRSTARFLKASGLAVAVPGA